jgi:SAM-dependent methyltransferase
LDAEYRLDDLMAAEPWHFWFRARRQLVIWALRSHFPRFRSVLDVGCGTGFVLGELQRSSPGLLLAGCDILFDAVRCARRRLEGIGLFEADVQCLPLRRQFDAIMALDVIEHLDDDESALGEMFRGLNPGGGVVITVPQHDWLWSAVDDFSQHRRRYSRSDLIAKMTAAGFEVLRCTSFFTSTLPLVALQRLRPSRVFDPVAELRISRAANAIVAALLQPEWLLIRAGVSLPVGGSLLVVARRPPS